MASKDLWTMQLQGAIDWEAVQEFLEPREREGYRLEYRMAVDAHAKRARMAETVGAMANVAGGLILVGVETEGHDLPKDWWNLPAGKVRAQAIENHVRAQLAPPVPLEIGIATHPEKGTEILVVRVREAAQKPVFVSNRGILMRVGQESIPAPTDQIRTWLAAGDDARSRRVNDLGQQALSMDGSNANPRIMLAVGPSQPWPSSDWGDQVDDAFHGLVRRHYPGLSGPMLGERHTRYQPETEAAAERRWVSLRDDGVLQRWRLIAPSGNVAPLSALVFCSEVRRSWELARAAIPVVLPGYSGGIDLVVSVAGLNEGVWSPKTLGVAIQEHDRHPIGSPDRWRRFELDRPMETAGDDLAGDLLVRMLRALGYRRVGDVARMLATMATDDGPEPDTYLPPNT